MTKIQFSLIMRALFLLLLFVGGGRRKEELIKLKTDYIHFMNRWKE